MYIGMLRAQEVFLPTGKTFLTREITETVLYPLFLLCFCLFDFKYILGITSHHDYWFTFGLAPVLLTIVF